MNKRLNITKEQLEDLYINKKLSSLQIADKLGNVNSRTIRKKIKKFNIQTRSLSKSLTKKFKAPFLNNPIEKAFLLGLRLGDFYARQKNHSVRFQTTSTHQAQVELCDLSFKHYGETKTYLSKSKIRDDEWFIYVDLHHSFDFLLNKPQKLPRWILSNSDHFYSFLSAYSDCEANWNFTKSHEKHSRFTFRIRANDLIILKQIKKKLELEGFTPTFSLETKKGTKKGYGTYSKDLYNLTLNRKTDIRSLINKYLPLSKHSEKIRKMKLILENQNKRWSEVKPKWDKIREDIKKERLQ